MLMTAIPNGTLLKVLKDLLEPTGVEIIEKSRGYMGSIERFSGLNGVIFARPNYVLQLVSSGLADIGITGLDMALEQFLEFHPKNVRIVSSFTMSRHCFIKPPRIVLATRKGEQFQDQHKNTVFSEFPRLTRMIMKQCRIVPSVGATENMVGLGMYNYGVCLADSGTSLVACGLAGQTILDVPVVCIARKDLQPGDFETVLHLCKFIRGTLRSRTMVLMKFNVPNKNNRDRIAKCLAQNGYLSPTESDLIGGGSAFEVEVPRADSHLLEGQLSPLGGEKFIQVKIEGAYEDVLPEENQFDEIVRRLREYKI